VSQLESDSSDTRQGYLQQYEQVLYVFQYATISQVCPALVNQALQSSTFQGHPFYACCTSQYVGKTTQILPQLFLEKMSRESSATPTSSSTPTSSPQKLKLFHGDLEINSVHLYPSLPNKLKMVKATLSH